MNDKSIENLIEELDVYDAQKCVEISEQIVEYGNDAIAPLFNAFFFGTKTSQKEYMLQALATLLDSETLIEELLKYIDDARGFTRYYSLQYLFDFGNQSVREKLIPHMIADIGGHYYCNDFARNTLPKCSEYAIDQIISALMIELEHQSEHNYERLQHLIWILASIDDDKIIQPLITALYSIENEQRYKYLRWTFERVGRKIVPHLINVIRDDDANIFSKRCAVNTLYSVPDTRAVEVLIHVLDYNDYDIRYLAIGALGNIRDKRATPYLIHILETDKHERIRTKVASALGNIQDERAIPILIDLLKNDSNSETRRMSAYSLRHYSGIEVVTALVQALYDENEIVAMWATSALDEMRKEVQPLLKRLHKNQPELIERAYNTWSWEFIDSCKQDVNLQSNALKNYNNLKEAHSNSEIICPVCGKHASELTHIYISTPPETWKHLVGRAGWLTVCEECNVQVDFFLTVMN